MPTAIYLESIIIDKIESVLGAEVAQDIRKKLM
jgi:hypothetical protein